MILNQGGGGVGINERGPYISVEWLNEYPDFWSNGLAQKKE